ncbi:MAG TPA: helix-turn-helix transcriptional regulator, partial [Bacteroidia bacterium]|nr:helix-turn-helix transcriptional regulator [Bacteroidia bacterium]
FEERFSIRKTEPLVMEKELVHDLHRHDFYFALFIKKGKGIHEIDFVNYEVSDYSVFFLRPGQVHQLRLNKGTSGFMLQFAPDFYSPHENPAIQVLRKVSNKNHCQVTSARFEHIFFLLETMFREYSEKKFQYKESIMAYLGILFIELARQSANPNKTSDSSNSYTQERMEMFKELLEKHIGTKKQVSQYAEMLNITPYQLNSITKNTLQKTGSELINEHIVLEAKRLLIATTNQVNQVADLLGYDDPSYFIRFFKKHTGLTPEAFRQNFK